ncbi:hypothetical protein GCM10015535_57310 [Streptomyces gelaticus]|uniref:Secreted protein n=1 Tax=Streptomyces gelaticus TaxID=285446 RepID=A0ABQ2W5V8_9ACTN|nr:hypothetical protein GCM10015535_57310 [Streptomyces gelaticus]
MVWRGSILSMLRHARSSVSCTTSSACSGLRTYLRTKESSTSWCSVYNAVISCSSGVTLDVLISQAGAAWSVAGPELQAVDSPRSGEARNRIRSIRLTSIPDRTGCAVFEDGCDMRFLVS